LTISIEDINRLGISSAVDAHIARHWKQLFFSKARDWEQEREYRWLVREEADNDFHVDIRNSLVGVALGDRFPDTGKATVGRFAEAYGISIAVMNWQNGLPQPSATHWRLLAGS
jgi:hypothetical protein